MIKFMLGILKYQLGQPVKVFPRDTCYIVEDSVENRYEYIDINYHNQISSYYMRARYIKNNDNYKISIHSPYSDKVIYSTYSDPIAAANAYNYHNQFLYGTSPNMHIPYMPYNEWIKYRMDRFHNMFKNTRDQLTLYKDNEEDLAKRHFEWTKANYPEKYSKYLKLFRLDPIRCRITAAQQADDDD